MNGLRSKNRLFPYPVPVFCGKHTPLHVGILSEVECRDHMVPSTYVLGIFAVSIKDPTLYPMVEPIIFYRVLSCPQDHRCHQNVLRWLSSFISSHAAVDQSTFQSLHNISYLYQQPTKSKELSYYQPRLRPASATLLGLLHRHSH